MENIEIPNIEEYGSQQSEEFSHEVLVMRAMQKCLDAGIREMREGWYNEKADAYGNIAKTYIDDTRKAFIEAVSTLKMIMISDFDEDAIKNFNKIIDDLKQEFELLCLKELEDFSTSNSYEKQTRLKQGIFFKKGYLNESLPFYKDYIDKEIIAYRSLFEVLTLLSKRKHYFKSKTGDI